MERVFYVLDLEMTLLRDKPFYQKAGGGYTDNIEEAEIYDYVEAYQLEDAYQGIIKIEKSTVDRVLGKKRVIYREQ